MLNALSYTFILYHILILIICDAFMCVHCIVFYSSATEALINNNNNNNNNGGFEHDEADVTMIAYILLAAEGGKSVIRILTDDTDVFVLLEYWVWKMLLGHSVSDQHIFLLNLRDPPPISMKFGTLADNA